MSERVLDDFCLNCHWDAFDDSAAKTSMLPSVAIASDEWHCASSIHPPDDGSCEVDDTCCVNDTCSLNCSSVCDGFVACEVSTVCSEAHCSSEHCETTGPGCCEQNCVGDGHSIDQSIADFLANESTLTWDADSAAFLTTGIEEQNQAWQEIKAEPQITNASVNQEISDSQTSFSAADCPPSAHTFHHHRHHPCYPYPRDNPGLWSPAYSSQTDLSHLDMYDILGGVDTHHTDTLYNPPSDLPKFPCFQGNGARSCSGAGFQHLGCYLKTTGDTRLEQLSKPQPRSRVHRHGPIHTSHHRVSHYSRHHSQRSVSSHILSSPVETPPPLDGAISSALTSPTTGLVDEDEPHVCRWTYNRGSMNSACGAFFPSAALLQQHLIAEHMGPVDGMKGYGYYCRWDGCHRPDEPFSQKSKLQGHFLTHSNYKNFTCSVCGKVFARQATLERHERSHRGDKPFKCKECGKSFTDSSELKTHSRTHTGEKPFKCDFPGCNFQTGDSSNMSSHKLTHGVRKHKCNIPGCTKSFTRPDQLKRHLKTTHKPDALPVEVYPPFPIIGNVS